MDWCASLIAVTFFGRRFDAAPAEIQTASFICLALVGLWVLNVALRPLNTARITLVTAMYLLLGAVLLVPISQQYHLFALPEAELLAATFVAALAGCGLVELGHRLYQTWVHDTQDYAEQGAATQKSR